MITGYIKDYDYINAQRLHRAAAVRWYYGASVIAIAVGAAAFLLYQQRLGIIIACAGIGGLIGELAVSLLYLPAKARRIHRQHKDFSFPFSYSWDSDFIQGQGASGQSKRAWRDFVRCKEDGNLFLLYHSDVIFEMLPKSWFKNEAQIAEFRSLACQHENRAFLAD